MSEIQPPPKIYRPLLDEELAPAIQKITESMEHLAVWMYGTAREIERRTAEGQE